MPDIFICWLAKIFFVDFFFLENAHIFFLHSYCAFLFLFLIFRIRFLFLIFFNKLFNAQRGLLITKFFLSFDFFYNNQTFRTVYSASYFVVLAGDTALLWLPHQKQFWGLFGLTLNTRGISPLLHPWPLISPEK